MDTAAQMVKFGDLAIGDKFRLESFYGVKVEPRVCEESRRFYAGEVPGYPGKAEFHDWNAKYQFLGVGEWNETSLSPDTLVVKM